MDENFSMSLKMLVVMSPVGQDFIAQVLKKESSNASFIFFV